MQRELARGLACAGHGVVVLAPQLAAGREVADPLDKKEPFIIKRSSVWRRLLNWALGSKSAVLNRGGRALLVPVIFRLAYKLTRDAEVLIVGSAVPLGNVAAALKRLRPQLKVIVMTYGSEVSNSSAGTRMRNMLVSALQSADAVTCQSTEGAEELAGIAPSIKGRIHVSPMVASSQP